MGIMLLLSPDYEEAYAHHFHNYDDGYCKNYNIMLHKYLGGEPIASSAAR